MDTEFAGENKNKLHRLQLVGVSGQTAKVQFGRSIGGFLANNHHEVNDSVFVPAAEPAHAPVIDLLAQFNGFRQSKEPCFKLHAVTSMAPVGLDCQVPVTFGPQLWINQEGRQEVWSDHD